MWDLKTIKHLNERAVAEHEPLLLNDQWPEGEAQLADEPLPRAVQDQTSLTLSARAIFAYAELVLGADFSAIRRGLCAVIRGERHVSPTEKVVVSDLSVFAFLAMTLPDALAAWTEELEQRVAKYANFPNPTFNIRDRDYCLRIVVVNYVVTDVRPVHQRGG